MNYEMALEWIEQKGEILSYQEIHDLNNFIPILFKASELFLFSKDIGFFRSLPPDGSDSLDWFHLDSVYPADLEYIKSFWEKHEPCLIKAEGLRQSFKKMLLQQLYRFDGQEQAGLLMLLHSLLTLDELVAHEALWLTLFAQKKQNSPFWLVVFLLECSSEQAIKTVFEDYFSHLQTAQRLKFKHCENFHRLAPYFLEEMRADFQLQSVQDYLACFSHHNDNKQLLLDYLADWIQAHPVTLKMSSEAWDIAKIFVDKASDKQLERLIPLWANWLKHPELRGYHLALMALFRIYKPPTQALLSASLLQQETEPVRQDMLLRQAQRWAFVYRHIWWDAWQSGPLHLQARALQVLANMEYDENLFFRQAWPWSKPRPSNDPVFWLRLWKEVDCRAVQLNGACELFRAEPNNSAVRDWLVQQMEILPVKHVAKIWACLRQTASPDFCLELAVQHLDSPRPWLREQATRHLASLPASETLQPALIRSLQDEAKPVQIWAAKGLAVHEPQSALLNSWLTAQLEQGQDFVLAEALGIIERHHLLQMLPLLHNMTCAHSPRLQARLQRTLARLTA